MSMVRVALAEDNVLLREGVSRLVAANEDFEASRRIVSAHREVSVILCSTHDATDLPRDAATSGAIGYVSKEQLTADTLREPWEGRDSSSFVSC
jgi:hypothetical protein